MSESTIVADRPADADPHAAASLAVGARVETTMAVGGIVRPFVPVGAAGTIDAVLEPSGYVVRFDASHRAIAVHDDEVAEALAPQSRG